MMNLTIILKNKLSETRRLANAVTEFGRKNNLRKEIIHDVNLTLREIVINIVSYGHEDNKEHHIIIRVVLRKSELILEVEDDGSPFNPLKVPVLDIDKPIHKRRPGGMGIHLIRNLMDKMEYIRKPGKNILVMRKIIKN